MTTNHNPNNTPPSQSLPVVIVKAKEAYTLWLELYKDFPRIERLGVGQKIEQAFLELLKLAFIASYLPIEQKITYLNKTIVELDILKFFTQLSWENKLIATNRYSQFASKLEEIGRMLGGWRKGLEQKLPR